MTEKMKFETPDLTESNIEKLEELFPNCITEKRDENGKIIKAVNYEIFKQMFSKEIVEPGEEAYEFTWVGKKESILEANKPIRKTLRPCKEESKDWDNTENLYIEGDNLEVLKTLQESYLNSIKMIYIDPPYNTGNDFIYNDDFKMSNEEYIEETGQVDEDGNRLFKNTDTNGRFHSDWCSMMYPRLVLARNLLSDDGVIFISIDDNEQDNLKKICDEIFGETNAIRPLVIELSKTQGMKVATAKKGRIVKNKEYILIYTKDKEKFYTKDKKPLYEFIQGYDTHFTYFLNENNQLEGLLDIIKKEKELESDLNNISKIIPLNYKNIYRYMELSSKINKFILANSHRIFSDGNASINIPESIKERIKDNINPIEYNNGERKYLLIKTKGGTIRQLLPLKDTYNMSDDFNSQYGRTIIRGDIWKDYALDMGNINKEGNIVYKNGKKPIRLIKDLMKWQNDKDSIVLDFFSGSATTAHAVMDINAEDGGNRRFILVQIAEDLNKIFLESSGDTKKDVKKTLELLDKIKKPHYLTEIGKERIIRSGKQTYAKYKDKKGIENLDTGFRVLKIDDTNMKDVYYSAEDYDQNLLDKLESNIKDDRNDLDLLFGCLLDWGLPLDRTYESIDINGNKIHIYNSGDLIACFDDEISEETVKEIAKMKALRVVFRDSSFTNDPKRINIEEIFKLLSPDTSIRVI